MFEAIQDLTTSLPPVLQWLGVLVAGAVPFIESYFGSALGVVAGVNPTVAIAAAVVGNIASMVALVLGAHRIRRRVARTPKEPSAQRQKMRRAFDKYGVAGLSLVGQTILPSQITSMAMVSFGASRNAVIMWQVISIILWGIGFGLLATWGVDMLTTHPFFTA